MPPEEYIETRLVPQIDWYDRKSSANKFRFMALRWVEIVAAAAIPFLAGYASSEQWAAIVIGFLGMLIAICVGTTSIFQFQEHWIEYRTTAESLKKERFMYLAGVEPYDGDDAFPILVQRSETLISKENTNWAQYMMKPQGGDDHG